MRVQHMVINEQNSKNKHHFNVRCQDELLTCFTFWAETIQDYCICPKNAIQMVIIALWQVKSIVSSFFQQKNVKNRQIFCWQKGTNMQFDTHLLRWHNFFFRMKCIVFIVYWFKIRIKSKRKQTTIIPFNNSSRVVF